MRYRILGRTGLRVSQLALGTGNFGTGWGHGADEATSAAIYRAYREAGGNLVDTANSYQGGQSEQIVGRLIREDRDDVVLATKFSLPHSRTAGLQDSGNSRRALFQSVERSLRALATDRLDILWVHYPDGVTPIEELVRGLDDLVRSGKVLYVGFSNFPAWRVSAAAMLAELRGWAPVAAVQFEYSLVERTSERELLPAARAFGWGAFGWSPLGGGLLTGKYRAGEEGRLQKLGAVIQREDDARKTAILDSLLDMARDLSAPAAQVALSWVLGRDPLIPIIGPRTSQQLADHLGALDVSLSHEQRARLDEASAIPLGFPHDMNAGEGVRGSLTSGRLASIDFPAGAVR
ncbi:oxidoreductase [Sphingobium sp. 22B]|uniref:aldo/keto reductase n=1 Tax=unclassified Sphingobium TaxID=2611147 RepID=UPI000780559D|nr:MULTISPECIES: aldo/keto reductase [unclassified Sphingobium]KXU32689.1 oxidoreductase [Sphingobium sp. AM]KYC32766.1 oxidoreductase [Sphingobium sp. 22B]OAP31657.1 oxidoreductase [Sphingobium sp. 20006FA]